MSLRDVASWIIEEPTFADRVSAITAEAVRADLFLPEGVAAGTGHDWSYLLLVASLLAKTEDSHPSGVACRDAALRIAQHCLTQSTAVVSAASPTPQQCASAANVLHSLANAPALALAVRRRMLPERIEQLLPVPARLEWSHRRIENSVVRIDDTILPVNRFQHHAWELFETGDWISLSAPTSAGKSFIVSQWLVDYISRFPDITIVYLVPTRALISQVETDLNQLVRDVQLDNIRVSTLPLASSVVRGRRNILVMTQERLHILQNALPELELNVVMVDEAHKLGDGHRGVLLQQVLERIQKQSPNAKMLFASPMTENPEALIADAPADRRSVAYVSNEITVAQNLVWASQEPRRPRDWRLHLCLPERLVELGNVRLQATPGASGSKRLSYVAHKLGEARGGNIIYVNGAAEAEKVAMQLYGLRGAQGDVSDREEIRAVVDLARRTVHREFLLGTVLNRGVAFHYGNIPLLLRTEIERLFATGGLAYLVCTSTLIEGVNMACRAMFVRGPTKGRGKPMKAEDFWNLAGRAGRWGREFQGNVICVDASNTSVWGDDGPPRRRQRYRIRRTADAVVARIDELEAFVAAGTPRDEAYRRPDLEFVFGYLATHQLGHGSIREMPWVARLEPGIVERVEALVSAAVSGLRTPVDILRRNPGFSPLAMDALLRRFERPGRDAHDLMPVDPGSDDAISVYRAIFGRIAAELNIALGPAGRRSHALALLVTLWMRGIPLARLINERIVYERARRNFNVPATIRLVLSEVEQIARFEAPRSLACYIDVLKMYLSSIGRDDLVAEVPDLGVMLEFGVSLGSQVSLIALGLSRTTAVMLGELLTQDDLDEAGVLAWLQEGLWRQADLPALVKAEIERVLDFHAEAS